MKPPMVNRDGGEWRLCWSRDSAGVYHTWVEQHPEIRCEDTDWRSARDRLIERVDHELHAGEWAADWHPPEPVTDDDRAWTDAEYVRLVPDGRYVAVNELQTLFADGVCETCGQARGSRNSRAMTLMIELPGGMCMSFLDGGYPTIFQKRLVELLGPARLGGAEIRPTTRVGPGRIEYVELIPRSTIDSVVMKEPRETIGRECASCGFKSFSHRSGMNEYRDLYPASKIPRRQEAFWIDRGLCVRSDWWAAHRQRAECKGVLSRPLFVLRDDAVGSGLNLPTIKPVDGIRTRESRRHKARMVLGEQVAKVDRELCRWFMEEQPPSP